MPLLPMLRTAAVGRARFPDDQRWTAESLFAVVRDLPYGRPLVASAEAVIDGWCGTSAGKHILLTQLYREFGLPSLLMCATHQYTPDNTPWLPPELRALLADGPLPGVHLFLRLEYQPGEWMTIDATWPAATASRGLPVNTVFERGVDMALACDVDELFHVPPDADPWQFVAMLEARHVGAQADRLDHFRQTLAGWLRNP